MNKRIWLSPPHMSGNELNYIYEAFETNWIAPLGPNVDAFENELQDYLKIKYAAALSSGTAAIHLALILSDVKAGDEVLVSSFTFSATVNPIIYQGATPVFIDSEKDTWNMDPELLELAIKDRISKGKKPKAVIFVHLYGMPGKIDKILAITKKYDIPLIEDAAEALGSKYKGKCVGTFGEFGILSFNGNKIITTSGGGALVSNNETIIKKAKFLSTQARDNAPHYQHSEIGYNYRMSNILAGIGRGQMEVLNDRINKRREINKHYKNTLSGINGISFLNEPSKDYFSNFWLTTILIDPLKTGGVTIEKIRLSLSKISIDTRPLWKPMHLQPIFLKFPKYINKTSEQLFNMGLCLPSGSNLSNNDLGRIVNAIVKLIQNKQL